MRFGPPSRGAADSPKGSSLRASTGRPLPWQSHSCSPPPSANHQPTFVLTRSANGSASRVRSPDYAAKKVSTSPSSSPGSSIVVPSGNSPIATKQLPIGPSRISNGGTIELPAARKIPSSNSGSGRLPLTSQISPLSVTARQNATVAVYEAPIKCSAPNTSNIVRIPSAGDLPKWNLAQEPDAFIPYDESTPALVLTSQDHPELSSASSPMSFPTLGTDGALQFVRKNSSLTNSAARKVSDPKERVEELMTVNEEPTSRRGSTDCESARIIDRSVDQLSIKTTEPDVTVRRPRIAKYARVVQAALRLQILIDLPHPEKAQIESMLTRIQVTLATDKSFSTACDEMCEALQLLNGGLDNSPDSKVPLSAIVPLLQRWQIPDREASLFWSALRKSDSQFHSSVLPFAIDRQSFSSVLGWFLRRVRNKHSARLANRKNILKRNNRSFDAEYVEREAIGSGSFGECVWVQHLHTRRLYACKKISLLRDDVDKGQIEAELEVMKSLDHPNVLRVFEWFETEDMYSLILEAAQGGDLKGLLHRAKEAGAPGLQEPLVQMISLQALRALAYMHNVEVIHRDVKPANMLLAREVRNDSEDAPEIEVMLADFGLAELFGEALRVAEDKPRILRKPGRASTSQRVLCGTLPYMSLEVFQGAASPASDMWALGVSMFELFTHKKPIKGDNQMAFYATLRKKDIDLELVKAKNVSDDALQFLSSLFQRDATQRPSAQQALTLPWFGEIRESRKDVAILSNKKFKRSLTRFRHANAFTKVVSLVASSQLDASSIRELNMAFKAIDKDGTGTINEKELAEGLAIIGLEDADPEALFDSLDLDHDGSLNYTEFIASLIPTLTQGKEDQLLDRAFSIFDSDGNGKITNQELRAMLCGGSMMASLLPDGTSVEQVLKEVDTSGDGVISLDEFKSYLQVQRVQIRRKTADMNSQSLADMRKMFTDEEETKKQLGLGVSKVKEVDAKDMIVNVIQQLGSELSLKGQGEDARLPIPPDYEVLCEAHARRLMEHHWLFTVEDLRELEDCDWPHLGLPMKLQSMLKAHIREDVFQC